MNLYSQFRQLLPGDPLDVGEVIASGADGVRVRLVGGGLINAIGEGAIGSWVYVQGGAVMGPAPAGAGEDVWV